MPSTPVRDIELIEVGSLGKETLSNDSFTNLSLGISGAAIIPLSSTDHTLTTTNDGEAMRFVLILTGTLTANVNVLVPAESRVYVVDNRTTGAFTVTCRPAAGGGVAVDQSARTLIYCDGSNVYPVASGTGGGGGGSGAPTDASYLVGASHTLLSGERVVTDTATVTWDLGTAGQARALIPPDAVSYAHIQNVTPTRLLGRFTAGSGDVQEITPGTGLTLDASGVLSATAVGQPLDATLTALAGLTTGANLLPYFTGVDTVTTTTLSAFVRTLLDDGDAATARSTLGAQASDATLTALAGVTTGADTLAFFTGVDTASTTTLTAFMRGLLDDPDLATAQATLGITGGGYTDEQAQDAVGTILTDSPRIDFTYTDATPAITADIVAGSITETQLGLSDVTADNATTSQHGFLPKLSGTATTYLDGTGAWTTPAGGGAGGAPTDAEYIVGSASTPLTQERVLTNTPTVSWDLTTAGQAKAVVPDASLTEAKLALSDVLTANASTTAHGLLRKLSGTATQYLDGSGAWSTPAGGSSTFLALSDVPDSYTNQGGKFVQIATAENAVTFTRLEGNLTVGRWTFRANTTMADPGNTFVRFNGATYAATTQIAISGTTNVSGVDGLSFLRAARVGDVLYAPQIGSNNTYARYVITATTDNTTWFLFGVAYIGSGAGTLYIDFTAIYVQFQPCVGTWLALADTPDAYTGQGGKVLQVNAGATATEFGPVLGSMAQQDASAVAITGGAAVFSTLESVTASVARSGINVPDKSGDNVTALYSTINEAGGSNRWYFYSAGTVPSFHRGNLYVENRVAIGANATPDAYLRVLYPRQTYYGLKIQPSDNDTGVGSAVLLANQAGTAVGSIHTTASATAFNTSSDVRLKHSIAPLTGSLAVIAALNPVAHRWNATDEYAENFLAHELQRVLPYAVTGEPDAVNEDGSIRPQQVDASKIIPRLVGAVKELLAQVEALTVRVAALEGA